MKCGFLIFLKSLIDFMEMEDCTLSTLEFFLREENWLIYCTYMTVKHLAYFHILSYHILADFLE